ncbi:hypothetical protein LEN26_003383 [Aphanomyces euteiches]|nr:hypothetical protein LEN26_003383 [Aphanomyces euteiches]
MARQNKRTKGAPAASKDETNGHSTTNVPGAGVDNSVKETVIVKLLLNDPSLLHHSQHLKKTWAQTTGWEEHPEMRFESFDLLVVQVSSDIQMDVVKDIATSGVVIPPLDVTTRLQVENNSSGERCLRLTLQLSDAMQAFLAKLSNTLKLKLESHNIKASSQYEPKVVKKLRSVVLWSLDPTTNSPQRPSLHDEIAETNRESWRAPISLRTIAVTKSSAMLSSWTTGENVSMPQRDHSNLQAQLLRHVSFDTNTVVIMRGRPGSGKSTLTRVVQAMAHFHGREVEVCSADTFFETPLGYYHDRNKLSEAHDACKAAFADAIARSVPVVVVDNTHSCLWEYELYRTDALAAGYRVCVLEVACADVTTAMRMALRNSHGVGMDVVLRMHQRWEAHTIISPEMESHLLLQPTFSSQENRRALALLLQGDVSKVYISAVYFDEATRTELLSRFPPKHEKVIAEHMTLAFQPTLDFVQDLDIGQDVRLRVVEERFDSNGHCLKLEWVDNSVVVDNVGQRILHITLSFPPTSSAYYSNSLLQDDENAKIIPIQEPLIITGRVGVALQSSLVPKYKKAQILDIPRSAVVGLGRRQITLIALDDGASDAIVAEITRVAVRGNILVLVASSPLLVEWFGARQIQFDLTLIHAASIDLNRSVQDVVKHFPEVGLVQVITTLACSVDPLPFPIAVHCIATSSVRRNDIARRQFFSDLRDQICHVWQAIAQDTFVDAVAHVHQCSTFDVYLSATGHVPLDNLKTRLVEALRHLHLDIRDRSSPLASDQWDYLDAVATECYTTVFRIVLFVPSAAVNARLLSATAQLFSRRPTASAAFEAVFETLLQRTPLPFCDSARAIRVLAASLGRAFVQLHPSVSPEMLTQYVETWDETPWLVLLAQAEVDPVAMSMNFHTYLGLQTVIATPGLLKDLELVVARALHRSSTESYSWFTLTRREASNDKWSQVKMSHVRHNLWQLAPREIVFCDWNCPRGRVGSFDQGCELLRCS